MPGYRAARTGVVMSGQLLVALCGALLQNTVANVRLVKLKRPSRKLTSQLCRPANTLKHCWYSVILLIHRHSKLGSRRYTPTMNLRCRGPSSQATLTGLEPGMTIAAFQELLADRLGVPTDFQEILAGFPPTLVQMPPETSATPLSTLGIANGDTLVLRRMAEPAAVPATAPAAAAARPSRTPAVANTATAVSTSALRPAQADQLSEDEQLARAIAASLGQESTSLPQAPSQTNGAAASSPVSRANGNPTSGGPAASLGGSTAASTTLSDGSCVVRRKVDDDNSCLFSAVSYVMEGSRSHAAKLRRIIADAVAADPFTYNDGFLGKSNEEYRKWILDPKKWGGAIELSIFARHFGREIAAHDIRTKRCDVYGSGEGYQERVMLIYDGLHYDALALAAFQDAPEELDVTIIEPAGEQSGAIAQAAAALTAEANQARQFTDTASFTLRCGTCKIGVKGEKEALEHAKATGHANFSEYH